MHARRAVHILVRCRTSWGEPEREVRTQVAGRQAGRQAACMHTRRDVHSVPCDCFMDSEAPPGLYVPLEKLPSSSCVV